MGIIIPHIWFYFGCCLLVSAATTIIMMRQARNFYYKDTVIKKFSIMNLEWPTSMQGMIKLIGQIKDLPEKQQTITLQALRGQLYVDFLFMPATYTGILLLCIAAANDKLHFLNNFLILLAYLQLLAWVCDIIENIYILHKIKLPVISPIWVFTGYRMIEILKWGISIAGFLSASISLIASLFK